MGFRGLDLRLRVRPVVARSVGLAGHHLEECGAGSGLVGRRGHWVQEARRQCGVEFREAGREGVRVPVAARWGCLDEVHDWGAPPRREPNPVVGGWTGRGSVLGLGLGLGRGGDGGFSALATFGFDGLVL